jgi:predicted porin
MNFRLAPLALALTALGTSAFAQSSVTVYGRVDLSVAQQANAVKNTEVRNGSGSRLGFRGVEDLGDGLQAVFQIEHRFNAADGSASNATRFWDGKAIVGLQNAYGRLVLGREENPAYTYSQGPADPWGTDTVASNANIVQAKAGISAISTRYSSAVTYSYSGKGLNVGAQVAEGTANAGSHAERPFSLGGNYSTGALTVGAGYENPSNDHDYWATLNGAYDLGVVKLGGLYGSGKNAANQKIEGYLLSAVAPVGGGSVRASYGELKNKDTSTKLTKQAALGYQYGLSKRTTVYADVVRVGGATLVDGYKKVGYDLGIKHNF